MQTINGPKTIEPKKGYHEPIISKDKPSLLNNLVAFFVGLPALILILEGLFAICHVGEESVLELQPYVGFGHLPNSNFTCRQEGFSRSRFNALGARDWDPITPKASGVKRIVVMGDSVTEAAGVPSQLAFGKLLELKLNQNSSHKYEVLNFGSGGYGTLQEFYHYLLKVRKVNPDIVILGYHQGDSDDNFYQKGVSDYLPRPYCSIDAKGNLVTDWSIYDEFMRGDGAKSFYSNDFLRKHSRIAGVYGKVTSQLSVDTLYLFLKSTSDRINKSITRAINEVLQTNVNKVKHPAQVPSEFLRDKIICSSNTVKELADVVLTKSECKDAWGRVIRWNEARFLQTCGVINALAMECQKDNCRLVLVGLPAAEDNGLFNRQMNTLEKLAKRRQFTFIDTNRDFRKLNPAERQDTSFQVGHHLKVSGHEFVANKIYKELKHESYIMN